MTSIKPPKKLYKDLNKLRRRFLWAGSQQLHGGKCKVNWETVCRPLRFGGPGISNLAAFGRALRLRWLWYQWRSPDKPWCNSELPIFTAATRVTVHDGCTARFWSSSWLGGKAPVALFPSLFNHSKQKNRTMANALENDNWIADLMHNISAPLLVELILL
jgi:hypothetical protein